LFLLDSTGDRNFPTRSSPPTEAAHIILFEQDWYQASEGEINRPWSNRGTIASSWWGKFVGACGCLPQLAVFDWPAKRKTL